MEKFEQIVKQECKGKTDNIQNIASRNNINKISALVKKNTVLYIECVKPSAPAPQAKPGAPAPQAKPAAPAPQAKPAAPALSAQGETSTFKNAFKHSIIIFILNYS